MRVRVVGGVRSFATLPQNRAHPKRVFDPTKILPHELGKVRILNNTARDAQQSNLSAEMADEHRQAIGKLINAVYKDIEGPPGYEQIWGGTVPMFDIWKRGVDPFVELREMSGHMPQTPGSALIRSNGINAMNNQPKDVVNEFIRLSGAAGVDVFTNFCAHNDWRNHVNVANAVQEHGYHYQAAISWAVYNPNPTIYNVQWAVDLFRELVALGAHSLYVKDPSGVLTPEMAGVLAGEVKAAFPHLPLCFHTHYQTGYGYMAYLKAVENGANGIECSLGFHDGAGQPYGLTMARTLEDLGYDTGRPNHAAMQAIANYCKSLGGQYTQDTVRRPDVGVEKSGIAGGQRSILDKELIDAGQPHLLPQIDEEVAKCRAEGGTLCQVTPVADSYAREAMRRLRGGSPHANFAPGYATILTGQGGLVQEPVHAVQQKQALWERAKKTVDGLEKQGKLPKIQAIALLLNHNPLVENDAHSCTSVLSSLRAQLDARALPIQQRGRIVELKRRADQLRRISENAKQTASMDRQLARSALKHHLTGERIVKTAQAREDLQGMISALEKELGKATGKEKEEEAAYDRLLLQTATDAEIKGLLQATLAAQTADGQENACASEWDVLNNKDGGLFTAPYNRALHEIISGAAWVSRTAQPLLLGDNGLAPALAELKVLKTEHNLALDFDAKAGSDAHRTVQEWSVLWACYKAAAIPNLALNFFRYVNDPVLRAKHWPKTYKPKAVVAEVKKVEKTGPKIPNYLPDNFCSSTRAAQVNIVDVLLLISYINYFILLFLVFSFLYFFAPFLLKAEEVFFLSVRRKLTHTLPLSLSFALSYSLFRSLVLQLNASFVSEPYGIYMAPPATNEQK